jgi:hypothetical protein
MHGISTRRSLDSSSEIPERGDCAVSALEHTALDLQIVLAYVFQGKREKQKNPWRTTKRQR